MNLLQFDIIVRVAGATLLLVAAVTLWRREPRADRRFFAPFAVCLCGYLAGNAADPGLRLTGEIGRLAVLLSGLTAVFLWWFCLSVFDWAFRPRGPVLGLGLAWLVVALADRGVFGAGLEGKGLSWLLIVMGVVMMGHLAWGLYRDRAGDLLDRRRRSRLAVVVVLAGLLIVDMAADVFLGLEWTSQAYVIAQNTACLAFSAWLLVLAGDRRQQPAWTRDAEGSDRLAAVGGDELGGRLRRLIEVEKVHLDPSLDLAAFVRAMGASERAVRALINRQLGYDHFRTFLNAQRMEEARRLLADPARRKDKLIVIAMDSGFASLASFNRVFQMTEGMTPSAYRRARLSAGGELLDDVAGF